MSKHSNLLNSSFQVKLREGLMLIESGNLNDTKRKKLKVIRVKNGKNLPRIRSQSESAFLRIYPEAIPESRSSDEGSGKGESKLNSIVNQKPPGKEKARAVQSAEEHRFDYLNETQESEAPKKPIKISQRISAVTNKSLEDKVKEIVAIQNSIRTKTEKITYSSSPDPIPAKSYTLPTDSDDNYTQRRSDRLIIDRESILKNIQSGLKTSMREKLQVIRKIEEIVDDPTIDAYRKKDMIYNMHIHSKHILPQQANLRRFLKEKKRLSRYTGAKIILDSFGKNSKKYSQSLFEIELANQQLNRPRQYAEKNFADYYKEFLKRQSPEAVIRIKKSRNQSFEEAAENNAKMKVSSSLPSLFPNHHKQEKSSSFSPEKPHRYSIQRSYENFAPNPKVIKVGSLLQESQTERKLLPKYQQNSGKSSFRLDTSQSGSRNYILKPNPSEFHSSSDQSRKNYLPILKEYVKKHKTKKETWENIVDRDLTKTEKCKLLKMNVQMIEEKVKRAQLKAKYMKSAQEVEDAKESLDQYYVDSIKSKLAIINQLAS